MPDRIKLWGHLLAVRYWTWKRRREIIWAFEGSRLVAIGRLYRVPLIALALLFIGGATVLVRTYDFSALRAQFTSAPKAPVQRDAVKTQTAPSPPAPDHSTTVHDSFAADTAQSKTETGTDTLAQSGTKQPLQLWTPPETPQLALVANKATGSLHLYRSHDNSWQFVKKYEIATGQNDGKKLNPGDRKTPEGLYFIIGLHRPPDLLPKYGPMAYEINFPNSRDRRIDRSGSGIWIHGTSDGAKPESTRGCIAMGNRDLVDLSSHIGIGIGTPLVIVDLFFVRKTDGLLDPEVINERRREVLAQHRKEQERFASILSQWQAAWVEQNMNAYATFYDTSAFFGQGLRWDGWQERKARTFDNYSFINVLIEDLVLTTLGDSLAVVEFVQTYSSDLVTIRDWKTLTFAHSSSHDEWKIRREESFPLKERAL